MSALPLRQLPDFFATAKRFHTQLFSVTWQPSLSGEFRFTVIVKKTAHKKAVDRNRLKRRSREAIRANLANLPKIDAAFFPNHRVETIDFNDLVKDVAFIAQKLSLLNQ